MTNPFQNGLAYTWYSKTSITRWTDHLSPLDDLDL